MLRNLNPGWPESKVPICPNLGGNLAPREHSLMSGDIFIFHKWGECVLLESMGKSIDAAQHPTMHRTALLQQRNIHPEI